MFTTNLTGFKTVEKQDEVVTRVYKTKVNLRF